MQYQITEIHLKKKSFFLQFYNTHFVMTLIYFSPYFSSNVVNI